MLGGHAAVIHPNGLLVMALQSTHHEGVRPGWFPPPPACWAPARSAASFSSRALLTGALSARMRATSLHRRHWECSATVSATRRWYPSPSSFSGVDRHAKWDS